MILRTKQLLLAKPSRRVIEQSTLAKDASGEKYAAEIVPDSQFPGIVLSPDRYGGQPTFLGRRITVATIAGMVAAGEDRADLAADHGLSIAQVDAAVSYANIHSLTAA
jgi:uncharacterized protein (DUF433 family)